MNLKNTLKTFGGALLLLTATNGISQQTNLCANKAATEKLLATFPERKQVFDKFREKIKTIDFSAISASKSATAAAQYTIPVVFHILHVNGVENIKDNQVIDAVKIMNIDFRKMNADTTNIVPAFKNLAADCKIEFRLATKDPLGNCTNGINHYYDQNTVAWQGNFSDYVYTWDNTKYLNIYVVHSIGFNAAGYTFLPGTAPPTMDAIVILHDYCGSIGTGSPFKSRALTHEIGHWLGLDHVWGGTNNPGVACGDDGVPDTPLTEGHQSCQLNSQQCTPGVVENVQNYMEYAYCSNMFTIDQRTLMHTVLNDNNLDRITLYTPANLAFTGVTSPTVCAPICNFFSNGNKYSLCAGKTLTFTDFSTNGIPNTYAWTSTGSSTLSTPSASTTNIYFPTPGTYTVSLTTQNGSGSSTATKTVVAYNSTANYTTNYAESFETSPIPAFWQITNPDAGTTWAKYAGVGSNGSNSYYIEGNANPAGQEDFLQTGIYDLLANQSASLTVDVAYARSSSTHNDVFKIQATKDCGATWIDIYAPSMGNLANATGGTSPGSLIPISSQWKTIELHNYPNFVSLIGQPSVSFRFYFMEDNSSGFGNRMFIDNLNFTAAPVGISEISRQIGYEVYPNPANSNVNIKFTLSSEAKVKMSVYDAKGSVVIANNVTELQPGEHILPVNTSKLAPGMYFTELDYNGIKLVKKLIVQ